MTRGRKSKFNLLNTYYVPKTVLGKYKGYETVSNYCFPHQVVFLRRHILQSEELLILLCPTVHV